MKNTQADLDAAYWQGYDAATHYGQNLAPAPQNFYEDDELSDKFQDGVLDGQADLVVC